MESIELTRLILFVHYGIVRIEKRQKVVSVCDIYSRDILLSHYCIEIGHMKYGAWSERPCSQSITVSYQGCTCTIHSYRLYLSTILGHLEQANDQRHWLHGTLTMNLVPRSAEQVID